MKNILTKDKAFYKSLILLAIPVALQNLITFLITFADNFMVSKLGDAAVSGVYMGGQLQTFLQVFTVGIESAAVIISSRSWGKRDTEEIKLTVSTALHTAVICGVAVTALCLAVPSQIIGLFTKEPAVIESGTAYLRIVCCAFPIFCVTQVLISAMRSVETAKAGMFVSLTSLVVNVCLNYCLIEGHLGLPALGIRGAAVATVCARCAECAIIAIYVLGVDKKLRLRPRDFTRTSSAFRKVFLRCALPLVGGQVVWSINLMGNSAILGHFDAAVISAASVANTMNTLAYVVMNGMATAVGIITGKTIGEGRLELMKEYARTTQLVFFCVGLLTGGGIFLARTPFVGLYGGISAEAARFALQFTAVLSVTMVGTCYQAACLMGLVKSGGDVSFVFKNDTIFVMLVVLPSAIIASYLGAPPVVVYACLKCDQILKCFVAVFKINSFNWIKPISVKETKEQETA